MTRNESGRYDSEGDNFDEFSEELDEIYDEIIEKLLFFLSRNPQCSLRNPGARIQWEKPYRPEYVEYVMCRSPPRYFL